MMNSKKIISFFLAVISFGALWIARPVKAASLYLSPSSGSYKVGQIFTVSVYTGSTDQAMNTAAGNVVFPSDVLEATGVSKSGSIVTLWTSEPAVAGNSVHFEGLVLNPGYTGASGKLLSITFKVKQAGEAVLNFSGASVLANDGKGTNILISTGSGKYTLGSGGASAPSESSTPPDESSTPDVGSSAPSLPVVTSSSHPNSNNWYRANNVQLSWRVPSAVNGMAWIVTDRPTSNPGSSARTPQSSLTLSNEEEGVHYFHLRFRTAQGWGPIAHFKYQIDVTAPQNFSVAFVQPSDSHSSKPILQFSTTDTLSGIDYYEVKVGDQEPVKVDVDQISHYALPTQQPGERAVVVRAYDKAGNVTNAEIQLSTTGIESPVILRYPSRVSIGDLDLKISGTAIPLSTVTLTLRDAQDQKRHLEVRSGSDGAFEARWLISMQPGVYSLTATVKNDQGEESAPSTAVTITAAANAFMTIGTLTISYLSLGLTIVCFLLAGLFIIWSLWHHFHSLHRGLRRKVRGVDDSVHSAFDIMQDHMRDQLVLLEKAKNKRDLTKEEHQIMGQLRRDIKVAERFLHKKIKDIEDSLL